MMRSFGSSFRSKLIGTLHVITYAPIRFGKCSLSLPLLHCVHRDRTCVEFAKNVWATLKLLDDSRKKES